MKLLLCIVSTPRYPAARMDPGGEGAAILPSVTVSLPFTRSATNSMFEPSFSFPSSSRVLDAGHHGHRRHVEVLQVFLLDGDLLRLGVDLVDDALGEFLSERTEGRAGGEQGGYG